MGSKKISELTTGSLNPPLTAVTPVVYSGETFQQELTTLREVLVDSGSHEFRGDQLFIGDVVVEGSHTQKVNSPELNEKIDFITVGGSKVDDTDYTKINFSLVNKNGANLGNMYQNSFVFDYFNDENEDYGTSFLINGKNVGFLLKSSVGTNASRFLIRETESGSTFMSLFADEMRIGCGPQTCSSGITIGNINASFIRMRSQKNDFEGDTTITGSLNVNGFTILSEVSSSLNFNDDLEASNNGVPLGGLYRSGSFIMIRMV